MLHCLRPRLGFRWSVRRKHVQIENALNATYPAMAQWVSGKCLNDNRTAVISIQVIWVSERFCDVGDLCEVFAMNQEIDVARDKGTAAMRSKYVRVDGYITNNFKVYSGVLKRMYDWLRVVAYRLQRLDSHHTGRQIPIRIAQRFHAGNRLLS